jgi:putative membrane protein
MKRAVLIAILIGLSAIVAIVAHEGLQSVGAVLARGGWIMLLLVPIHALPLVPDALGWRVLIGARTPLRVLFWIASVRHAVGRLLPGAGIGGELVGIRLLARTGVSIPDSAASVVVEVLVTMASEFFFVMAGILCLIKVSGAVHAGTLLLVSLSFSLMVIIAFGLVLRHGSPFERLYGIARRLFGGSAEWAEASSRGTETDAAIRALCRSPRALLRSWAWQFLSMVVGCIETWAAMHWLIGDDRFLHALVLEFKPRCKANHVLHAGRSRRPRTHLRSHRPFVGHQRRRRTRHLARKAHERNLVRHPRAAVVAMGGRTRGVALVALAGRASALGHRPLGEPSRLFEGQSWVSRKN